MYYSQHLPSQSCQEYIKILHFIFQASASEQIIRRNEAENEHKIGDISGEYAESEYPPDPPVYHYTYTVDDDYTGTQIFADEARDGSETHGMYEVTFLYC